MKTLVLDFEAYAQVLKQRSDRETQVLRLRPRPSGRRRSRSSPRLCPPPPTRRKPRLADEVISIVNHELLSPISSLRGLTRLLLERDYPRSEQRRLIGVLHQETDRLMDLLGTFADLQRIESGEAAYHFQPVDLRAAVADSRPTESVVHCRLDVDVPEDLPPVRADRRRLTQVFDQLLDNAFKFTRPGSTVSVTARATFRGIVVTVADPGIGIPAADLPYVCEKFYRVPECEIDAGGTGLGLALARKIVEDHGGRLDLESEVGQGTTVTLALPTWKEESPRDRHGL